MSIYITQEVSLGPCIAPFEICTKFSLKVSVSTYITQEVSLGLTLYHSKTLRVDLQRDSTLV